MPVGTLYQPFEGGTLLIPSGPIGHHLFVVATRPCLEQNVALVNIAGRTPDPTCILQAGDHEFIKKPSWVYYRRARIESVAALRLGVSCGDYIL